MAENTRIQGDYKISFIQHMRALRIFRMLQDYREELFGYMKELPKCIKIVET